MKSIVKFMFVGALALSLAASGFAQQKVSSIRSTTAKLQITQCALKVSGMSCGGCAGMVENGMLKVEGVKEAKVDWKTGDVNVQYDPKRTTPEKIVGAFNEKNRGFQAKLTERE